MKPALAFIGTLLFAYLVGSFVAVSFDISQWSTEGRGFLAVMSVPFALIAAALASGKVL